MTEDELKRAGFQKHDIVERIIDDIAPACTDCSPQIVETRKSAMKRFAGRYRETAVEECAQLVEQWNGKTREGDTFHIAAALRALINERLLDEG